MITTGVIINRIKEELQSRYPQAAFYIQAIPASIQRPSFHICLDTDRSEDKDRYLTGETTSVEVVYNAPVDGEVPHELSQLAVYDNIKNVFRKGYISIDDRTLKVNLLRGGRKDKDIFLIIKLVYEEERPQQDTAYETINQIYLRMR